MMKSIAEFYGWVNRTLETVVISECTECGAEVNDQRGAAIYACERCMNEREE
jgi:predicted RNA-binding Zn-ribbon protein involved in translation (DUF1610 family)